MSVKPGVRDQRGDFVAGEMIVCVALDERFAERDGEGRATNPFTDEHAAATADVMTRQFLNIDPRDYPQYPWMRRLKDEFQQRRSSQPESGFEPFPSMHDYSREAGGDFSPLFRHRAQQEGQAPSAHVFVRLRVPGHTDWFKYDETDYDVVHDCVRAMNSENAGANGRWSVNEANGQPIGRVELVMPQWILTSTDMHSPGGGGGGPGAPPIAIPTEQLVELMPIAEWPPANEPQWPFHVRFVRDSTPHPAEQLVADSKHGEGVIVLVLDTAPTPPQVQALTSGTFSFFNPLLASLRDVLSDSRQLGDLPRLATEPTGGGKPYKMTDHGLFVAGLIHDIAPKAEIRLWRVLNEYGAGDLNTILCALAEALRLAERQEGSVVINLSLVTNMPVEDLNSLWASPRVDFDQRFNDVIATALGEELKTQCIGVAAAGNGSGARSAAHQPRQNPRYPARFDTVIAVAAANGDGNAARYADQGDDPGTARNGVATFGGDADRPPGSDEPVMSPKAVGSVQNLRDAPIGLMISDTIPEGNGPHSQPNETGWAFWAGSSFATPIISGLAACLVSNGTLSTTQIIQRICDLATEVGPAADLGVKGIPARQVRP